MFWNHLYAAHSIGDSHAMTTPSICCVFICTNYKHILKPHLCCGFYWRKPCHDHTFDLLCFHMYKPQSNSNSMQRRKSTVAAHKKEIHLNFLKNRVAPDGMARPNRFQVWTRFDWGLYIWKTSMPELWHFTCSCHCKFFDWTRIPGLFGVCTYENTACQRSGSQRAFLECLRGGLMLAYVVGSFAQTVCEHLEWQVHVFHRKFGTQQLLCV